MKKKTGADFQYSENEFVKLNRKILKWEWYSDPCTRDVFIHCLLKANWKSGKWKGYSYQRGQFITSLPSLASELGLSVRNVRTALDHLKSTGELTDWSDSKIRMITVLNYDKYQSRDSLDDRRLTGDRQASDRQATGDRQQYKNIKNIKEYKEKKNISGKAAVPLSGEEEKRRLIEELKR